VVVSPLYVTAIVVRYPTLLRPGSVRTPSERGFTRNRPTHSKTNLTSRRYTAAEVEKRTCYSESRDMAVTGAVVLWCCCTLDDFTLVSGRRTSLRSCGSRLEPQGGIANAPIEEFRDR
jgi:hypothetical protein